MRLLPLRAPGLLGPMTEGKGGALKIKQDREKENIRIREGQSQWELKELGRLALEIQHGTAPRRAQF